LDQEPISNQALLMIGTITAVVVAIYVGNWQADLLAQTAGGVPGFSTCGNGVCEKGEDEIVCPSCAVDAAGQPLGNCPPCQMVCPQDCKDDRDPPVCVTVDCQAPPQNCKYVDIKFEGNCQVNCGRLECEPVCGNGKCEEGENVDNCKEDCRIICPSILCAAPPQGCKYVDPREDEDGCQTSCGTVVCPSTATCGNGKCEEGEADFVDGGGCGPNSDPECLGPPAQFIKGTCPNDCEAPQHIDRCATMFCPNGCKDGECIQPSAPQVCHYNGGVYHIGDRFKDDDGCNTCFCEENGSVSCTEMACVDDDDDAIAAEHFRRVQFGCRDGSVFNEGGPTSCKSRMEWNNYVIETCRNRCDAQGCGETASNVYEFCGGSDNGGTEVCISGGQKYYPGESFIAPDGCNKCHCDENGNAACTRMACPDRPIIECEVDRQCNAGEVCMGGDCIRRNPGGNDYTCISSNDCNAGYVCSAEFGDCMSACPPGAEVCPDVCAGFCMRKEFAFPEVLQKCEFSDECPNGRICTKNVQFDCLEECPLSGDICAVLCDGRCIIPDIDGDEDDWQPQDHNEWSNQQYSDYEDEVRTAPIESRFRDIDSSTLEGVAANALANEGVIGGFPDGTFRGGQPVNRAEAAKFLLLARFGHVGDERNDGLFFDVLEGEWYVKYVIAAAEFGIISGYADGTFRPANTVNTAEFLKMLSEAFGLPQDLAHNYADVPRGAWFAQYAGAAQLFDLFPGRPTGQLQPERLLTRGEVAIAIYKLMENQ